MVVCYPYVMELQSGPHMACSCCLGSRIQGGDLNYPLFGMPLASTDIHG